MLKKKNATSEGSSEGSEGKADDDSRHSAHNGARALEGPANDTPNGPIDAEMSARFDMLEATFHADQRDIKARCGVPPNTTMP